MIIIINMIFGLARAISKSVLMKRIETFLIPQPGEGIAEVEIIQWLVKPEQHVKEFQILCEARTDKGFIEYKSPFQGKILEIYHKDAEIAKIGDPLFKIDVPDASDSVESSIPVESPKKPAESEKKPHIQSNKVLTTPAIRFQAKQNNIDLSLVTPTGKDGRILKEDLLNYLESKKTTEKPFVEDQKSADPPSIPKVFVNSQDTIVKMSPIQRGMLKSMTEALLIPHLTYSEDVYMEQLTEIRQQLKKTLKDVKLTYMPFFMKALSLAILDYPIINSSLLDSKNEYILKSSHNISFAMDTPLGLVVPNIKNVESKSILEIASEMSRIQELGQKGRLSDNDLSDGTVALSNIGSIGGTYAAPVILPPQVFIGALGTIRPRLEKVDGIITEKNILATSWSADHRIIDGATTARFVARWKALIENPSLMLLHLK